jgi:hypothetical protein
MRPIVPVAGFILLSALLLALLGMQGRRPDASTPPKTSPSSPPKTVPKDTHILLRPGKTYRIVFDRKLPLPDTEVVITPAFPEFPGVDVRKKPKWWGDKVKVLEQSPTMVRFRTLTLQEALQATKEAYRSDPYSRYHHSDSVDSADTVELDLDSALEFVRFEYKEGMPFMLDYMALGVIRSDMISLVFSVENERSRRHAKRVVVGARGLEFTPEGFFVDPNLSPAVKKIRFFLIPEGKDKSVYIVPEGASCPAPSTGQAKGK